MIRKEGGWKGSAASELLLASSRASAGKAESTLRDPSQRRGSLEITGSAIGAGPSDQAVATLPCGGRQQQRRRPSSPSVLSCVPVDGMIIGDDAP